MSSAMDTMSVFIAIVVLVYCAYCILTTKKDGSKPTSTGTSSPTGVAGETLPVTNEIVTGEYSTRGTEQVVKAQEINYQDNDSDVLVQTRNYQQSANVDLELHTTEELATATSTHMKPAVMITCKNCGAVCNAANGDVCDHCGQTLDIPTETTTCPFCTSEIQKPKGRPVKCAICGNMVP